MEILVTYFIRAIFHMVFFAGIIMLVWPIIDPFVKRVGKKIDYRYQSKIEILGNRLNQKKHRTQFYQHIDSLFYLVKKDYQPGLSFIRFVMFSFMVFIVTFLALIFTIGDLPNQITFGNPFSEGI